MDTQKPEKKGKPWYRPALGMAVFSLLLCGLFFPVLITALGQGLMPYQANGSLAQFHGKTVGSYLIDANFTKPVFFHARNDSASGVDPDITVDDAYSQLPRISNATGIPVDQLQAVVDQNVDPESWIPGTPYVDVLQLNLALISAFPAAYNGLG